MDTPHVLALLVIVALALFAFWLFLRRLHTFIVPKVIRFALKKSSKSIPVEPHIPLSEPPIQEQGGGGVWEVSREGVETPLNLIDCSLVDDNDASLLDDVDVDPTQGQVPWTVKSIQSGDMVEVYQYQKPPTWTVPSNKKKRQSEKNKPPRRDNIFRARRQVQRLILANAYHGEHPDKLLSLTFQENVTDLTEAYKHVRNFIRRLKHSYGPYPYVAVPAVQRERAMRYRVEVWHFHVVIFGLPFIPQDELVKLWGRGTVSIEKTERGKNPLSNIAKYISKDFELDKFSGHKRFIYSRELRPPIVCSWSSTEEMSKNIPLSDKYIELQRIYDDPATGKLIYTRYLLRR